MRPNPGHESEIGPIGATGIEARIYKGVKVTVDEVHPDTPAFGKFARGCHPWRQWAKLAGRNPLVLLGSALTEAEAKDGILTFDVEPATAGKPKQVTVKCRCWGPTANLPVELRKIEDHHPAGGRVLLRQGPDEEARLPERSGLPVPALDRR